VIEDCLRAKKASVFCTIFASSPGGSNCYHYRANMAANPRIRQSALIVLMAQMGSFRAGAPGKAAHPRPHFTQLGEAQLAGGRSTFWWRMSEVGPFESGHAASLCCSMKWARDGHVLMAVHRLASLNIVRNTPHARFLPRIIMTEELGDLLPTVKNVHVSVKERQRVIFLRRVEPGSADKSYVIEVAALRSSRSVIEARREVLKRHDRANTNSASTR